MLLYMLHYSIMSCSLHAALLQPALSLVPGDQQTQIRLRAAGGGAQVRGEVGVVLVGGREV